MKLCSACGRHVRETTCPFCGASVSSSEISRARVRGSRTARILAATAIVACGGTTDPGSDGGSKDASSDVVDDFSPQPLYGAVVPDAGKDAADASDASDASDADASGTALYGAPPPPNN